MVQTMKSNSPGPSPLPHVAFLDIDKLGFCTSTKNPETISNNYSLNLITLWYSAQQTALLYSNYLKLS